MHYLRISYPDTLYLLKSIGVEKDSTMGYAECPGLRAGTCFTYPAFDPIENRKIGIEIEPLIVMENSILDAKYLNLGNEKAAEILIKELLDSCKVVGGQFSLLWHNSELMTAKRKRFFLRVLEVKDG